MWNQLLASLGITSPRLEQLLLDQVAALDIERRPVWRLRDAKPSINFRDEITHLRAGLAVSSLVRKYRWTATAVPAQTTIELTLERRGREPLTIHLSYWDIDACIQAASGAVGINTDETEWLGNEIIAAITPVETRAI